MELQVFEERELLGEEFRIYGDKDNPVFLAKDVATWIGHSSITMMLKSIDEEEKMKISPKQSLGLLTSNNEYWFLTEDGLYEVLMQSRKPIAKEFKKKVKKILKDIRRTGGYVSNDDMFISTYLQFADESTKLMFKGTLETVRKQNELINEQNKVIASKDSIIDNVIKDDGLYAIGTVGKVLKSYNKEMGSKNIFKFMRNSKILLDCEGTQNHNLPYDRYRDYFDVKYVDVDRGFYSLTEAKTYFNGKGLKWFLNKLVKDGMLTSSQRDKASELL